MTHYRMKTKTITIAGLVLLASVATSTAQLSYDTIGGDLTEDFNAGLPTGAATPAWADNSTFTGWNAYQTDSGGSTPTNYRITSSGNSSAAQLYQYRPSAGSSNGALGTRPSGATGDMMTGVRITNNTGITLNSITLGYTGQQWFESETAQNNQLIVSYQLGSPANLSAGTWTTIDALDFNSPKNTGADTNLDGTLAANQEVLAPVTVAIADWDNGSDIWVRWYDANSSGFDQALAIDDVSFTAVPEPSTYALIASVLALCVVALRRRRS